MSTKQTVAVLGAGGTMGLPMARNIAGEGLNVRAWNRTPEKAKELCSDGVTQVADTPAETVDGADIILTILSDADAVFDVMEGDDGAAAAAADDAIWLQMSTIGIKGTERCIELAEEHGLRFVDAPVVGTKQPAEEGELIVLASGPDVLAEDLKEIFAAIGKKVLWHGEAGAGTRLKLVVNSWIVSIVEGAAETIAFAEGIGVDPTDFLRVIEKGPLDLPYLHVKGQAMLARSFDPRSASRSRRRTPTWSPTPSKSTTSTCRCSRRSRNGYARASRSTATRTSPRRSLPARRARPRRARPAAARTSRRSAPR